MLPIISEILSDQGLVFFLGSIRLLTFFFFSPFLGGDSVPDQLRFSLAILLTFFVYPFFSGLTPPPFGSALVLWLAGIVVKEVLTGFVLAYTASVIFWALLSAGFIMDNQRGAGMGQVTDPVSGESTSLFGSFLNETAIYLLFSSGAFLQIILFVLAGYGVCPPGFEMGESAREGLPLFLMGQFSRLMILSVLFAAPVMLICLLCDLSLGLINRFAPQLNVFFLSMPIKSALGLLMILLYLGKLMPLVTRELFSIGGHMDAFWRLLS